ncbi:MAG TPA: murein biosynthesis integral membrane protein MurJ [Flexilinea sp.]|nr:murein biosynthesis integral membrane protein MurJ [Flexilinea sp.]HPR71409.1 murein biosynthesis integral membrane protein MurJ [Flexilinea sp.]
MIESIAMEQTSEPKQTFMKSATILAGAMILSQIIGLISKGLMGAAFGASAEVDAFLASNRLTETLFNLVAGGALASAFVPWFSSLLDQKDEQSAWKLASDIANLLTIILLLISVACFIFAPQIVRYFLVPGFSLNDPHLQDLTVSLLRIQLPSVIIFGLSGLVMGILNTHHHFLVPGLAPAMYQLGIIFGVVFLKKPLGIKGLALGAVIGSFLHLLVQIPQLLSLEGKRYSFSLGLRDYRVRNVIKLMIPRQIGASAVQLNFLVNNFIASFLPAGSISAVTWGLSLMLMPQAAIAQSVATVSLPMFSVQAARGELDEMRNALASMLRFVILLALPAACGLILLGKPLVSLIFERRAFNSEMTAMVYWALAWYSSGLIFHCVVEVISRAFYAVHDTKTPVLVLLIAMLLNMGLSILLSRLFRSLGWMPHGGLALANTIATGLEMTTLLTLMRRKLHGLEGKRILQALMQSAVSAALMVIALEVWIRFSVGSSDLIIVIVGVILGVSVYAGMCFIFKVEELSSVRKLIHI